jgi:hypothetical protein
MQCVNCILADEMGLGKTLQSIAFVAHLLRVLKHKGPVLFIVPLRCVYVWVRVCMGTGMYGYGYVCMYVYVCMEVYENLTQPPLYLY